jgi:hypothetical protein
LGNCGRILNRYQSNYPNNIINHGYIESDTALEKIVQGDILLSIGNTDISLIPSKIYEYMSTGKPIIHFYTDESDRLIRMLDTYGLAICIEQNVHLNKIELVDLLSSIREIKGRIRNFHEVEEDFQTATPHYVAECIVNSFSS